jgi:NAD dependent epimerase/dehydratase family enzyme
LADLLFRGQAVYPTAAEAAGFEFRYKTLESALSQLFR